LYLLLTYLFSPVTILTAVGGAIIAGRWFSDSLTLNGEMICAFLAAWLLRPIILLVSFFTMDQVSFKVLAIILNFYGGTLFGAVFAAIGAVAYSLYDKGFE
jgi:hypothetical protein